MKKILKTLAFVIATLSLSLTSCTDKCETVQCPVGETCDEGTCVTDPNQDQHVDAYGDVILKKMSMMGNIKYKLILFAGGTSIIAEGSKVVSPSGIEYPLAEFWVGPGKLRNFDVAEADTKPELGEYIFTLKFSDGFVKEVKDVLEATETDLPNIIITHTGTEVTISWDAIAEADLYCVKLTELDIKNTKPFFKTAMLPATATSYTFNTSTSSMPGWMRSPNDLQTGTEYWVSVASKKVENGETVSGKSTDFQTSSCSKQKIIW
ncbi:MAG: hypothetical protein HF967_00165 [Methanosarcinales archaeon]|nr:hypothetical protein [Methanosarcinales archaeon]